MQYRQGSIGRVIVAKVEHGDDLLLEIEKLLYQEKIESAVMYMIGALQGASLVVGPQAATVPPEPVWKKFDDAREIVGIGTVFSGSNGPQIHLHAAIGRGEESLTGCIRKDSQVYLVVELILLEMLDSKALRTFDEKTGLTLLGFTQ